MKTLLILRHAKAGPHTAKAGDHARGLIERGLKASGAMGSYVAANGPAPDLVLCSDARRAQETMNAFLAAQGGHPKIEIDPGLYLAEPDAILRRLRKINDRFDTVMIVGHNPGLHDLARDLVKRPVPAEAKESFHRLEGKFPTAALAVLSLDMDSWASIDYGAARLEAFVAPRDLTEA